MLGGNFHWLIGQNFQTPWQTVNSEIKYLSSQFINFWGGGGSVLISINTKAATLFRFSKVKNLCSLILFSDIHRGSNIFPFDLPHVFGSNSCKRTQDLK